MQQVKSTARQNIFVASDAAVELLAGESQHYTETQSYKRNLVWQKHQHNTTERINYTPCEFDGPVLGESGKVKIVARSAYLQLLANDVISQRLKDQVEEGLEAKLAIHYLHSAYEQHCKKQQGPTAAAAALVALSIAFITYGTAGGWLGVGSSQAPAGAAAAGGATTTAGTSSMAASLGLTSTSTKIAAGIATSTTSLTINGAIVTGMIDAALCSTLTTISLNLANNGFDISKAVEALGKSENMRSLLTSMAVSGITAGFIEPLKQSKSGLDAVLQVEQTADLLTKVEHGLMKAGVQYSMSQLIEKGKHRTKFAAAMGGAIASSVADHLDFSICNKASMNKGIDVIAVKTSKAIIGGLGARVVGGKRAFLGGALGALVADLDVLAMNEAELNPKDISRHAKATELLAGFGSLLLKQDVNAAVKSANRVAENKAYAQVLHNKLQDIALANEAMLAKVKKFISSEGAAENDLINDLQKVNLEELLRDSGLSEEKIDELGELITEHNKAVIKATMQAEQNDNQDLGVASEQSNPLPSDPNLPPPSDGSPNAQASSSSNTAPNTENQQVPPASRDKEDTTQQNNSNKSGLFFSRGAKGISNADNSASSSSTKPRTSSEQQTVDPQSVPEKKQYSQVDIALQKNCKNLAGTLEPHVDRIGKFVEDHPYAMDAINFVLLTAAFSAGGIPGVVGLKSSIAVAGEEAAKDELVSRGVDVKDASIVVGAIALSIISPKGKPVSLEPVMPDTGNSGRDKPQGQQLSQGSFAEKALDFFIPTAGAESSNSSSAPAQNIPSDVQKKREAFELSLAKAQIISEEPGANMFCTRVEAEGLVTDICRSSTPHGEDVIGRQAFSDGRLHYMFQSASKGERLVIQGNGDAEYQVATRAENSEFNGNFGQKLHPTYISTRAQQEKNLAGSSSDKFVSKTKQSAASSSSESPHHKASTTQLFFSSLDPNLARSADDGALMTELKMYGRVAKNLRDGTVHAVTHPVDTVVDMGTLGLDLTCAASRAVGGGCFSDVGRSEARIEGIKSFWKNSDALDKREAILTSGAGLLFGMKGSVHRCRGKSLGKNPEWRGVIPEKNSKFNSFGDPLLKTIGDAKVTHTKEYAAIMDDLKKHGVEVVIRDGQSLAFSPASSGGIQGCRIILPEEFSISALRHEYGHFLDHKALEYPPFRKYMQQPEIRLASERRQYLQELQFAKEFKDPIARKALIENYLNEKDYIVSNFYTREYGKMLEGTGIDFNGGR